MRRISRKDRVILEQLSEQYGTDVLSTVVMNVSNEKNGSDAAVAAGAETSPEEIVLEYIKKIEGYRIRIREFHWDAKSHSLHNLADSMMDDLESYEDSIAEDFMGIIGYRIQVGAVVPKMPRATEIKALIDEIVADSLYVRVKISELPRWSGIVSLIDDCVHNMNKSKYLADLT